MTDPLAAAVPRLRALIEKWHYESQGADPVAFLVKQKCAYELSVLVGEITRTTDK
jgi:hypothetical protein